MTTFKMPRPVPTLTGKLVTLRAIDPARDVRDYYEMNLEPEMHFWTGNRVLASIEEAQGELERFNRMEDMTMWAIVDNATGRMVGRFFVCMEKRGEELVAGEGNRVAKPFWRKGHNREARRLVFDYVFNTLRADRIETECWTQNRNSYQSILAHGFRLIRELPECNVKHGKAMSKSHFELTKADYERARE